MICQGDFAFFIELPDIDSRPCFESRLFFVCHREFILATDWPILLSALLPERITQKRAVSL